MRTIIAGTDFTPSSLNACKYAALLAEKLHCKLTLFNMFEAPLMHTNIGLYGLSYAAIQKGNEKLVMQLAQKLQQSFPDLKIEPFVTSGSFALELEHFIKRHQVVAAVMGLSTKNWLLKSVYGSHGVNLAGKIDTPVIIVPNKYKQHKIANMVLAVDNTEKLHQSSLKSFEAIINNTGLKLRLLHIKTKEEILKPAIGKLKINGKNLKIEELKSKNIKSGIKAFCKSEEMDLIGLISKKHSVFYNFYAETNTSKLAYNASIPVMAINE